MKARPIYLVLLFCILAGCQTAVSPPSAPFICQEPGTVVADKVDETSRGYAYTFQVYLPPCYNNEREQGYPVLFLLPGKGGGPDDWFTAGVNDVADELIHSGQMPPFLIISTETTDVDPYGNIIFNDLLPYVSRQYRVQSGRPYTAVAGGSLGGIGAYRLGFQHARQFGSIGIFGSGLVSGEEPLLQSWLEATPAIEQPRVFFNCGEQDPLMLVQTEAMISLLDPAGIETELIVSPGGYNYNYWVSNMPAFLSWLAQKW